MSDTPNSGYVFRDPPGLPCPRCGAPTEYVNKMGFHSYLCGTMLPVDSPAKGRQSWHCQRVEEAQAALARKEAELRAVIADRLDDGEAEERRPLQGCPPDRRGKTPCAFGSHRCEGCWLRWAAAVVDKERSHE